MLRPISFCIIFIAVLYGRGITQTQLSSAVSSYSKFIDVPVNFVTGIPNINIPLFEIKEGPLSIPISLNYHSAGIKAGELAGDIGTGWHLSTGGVITRVINSFPDDDQDKGYYYKGASLVNDPTSPNGPASIDGEPDIFSFSIPGYSGRFIYDDQGLAHIIPRNVELKIQVYKGTVNGIYQFTGFKITDPQGTQYFFGHAPGSGLADQREYVDYGNVNTKYFPTTWFLLRILTHDKNHDLTYQYEDHNYKYRSLSPCSYVLNVSFDGSSQSLDNTLCNGIALDNYIYYQWNYVSSKVLTSITAENMVISTDRSTARSDLLYHNGSPKKITAIKMTQGTFCYKYQLTQSYFSNGLSNAYDKRLKLDQVQKISCDNSLTEPPFTFTYSGGSFLPSRLTHAIDHWGFYNGAISNNTKSNLVQNGATFNANSYTVTFGEANRYPVFTETVKGTLSRITYPTGGHTDYTFELNMAKDINTNNSRIHIWNAAEGDQGNCNEGQYDTDNLIYTLDQNKIDNGYFQMGINKIAPNCPSGFSMNIRFKIKQNGNIIFDQEFNSAEPDYLPIQSLNSTGVQPGSAEFIFEVEQNGTASLEIYYDNPDQTDLAIGGLRLKQIKVHDGLNPINDIIRNYSYLDNNSSYSSGVYVGKPHYIAFISPIIGNPELGILGWYYYASAKLAAPLSSFEGYHVYYKRVVEDLNGNGEIIYEFNVEGYNSSPNYPALPISPRLKTGGLVSISTKNEAGIIQNQTSNSLYETDSYYNIPGKKLQYVSVCSGFCPKITSYNVRNRIPLRFSTTTQTSFGISTTYSFTYDETVPLPKYLGSIKSEFTDSDGKLNEIVFAYTPTYNNANGNLYNELKDRNIVLPFKQEQYVNGVAVDGSEIVFGFYPVSGGNYTTSTSNVDIYVYQQKKYEMTWAEGIPAGAWNTIVTNNSYDSNGFNSSVTRRGWIAETYSYSDGLPTQHTFNNSTIINSYYQGTRLLEREIGSDGTSVRYTYDKLLRLSSITDECQNVVRSNSYMIASPRSSVTAKIDYPLVVNSGLDLIENITYFDGLGREIASVSKQGSPDGKDVILAQDYDKYGRVIKSYEAYKTQYTDGRYVDVPANHDYTLVEYYSTPLNLVYRTKAPGWNHFKTFSYGTSNIQITNHHVGGSYPLGSLLMNLITDENGNKTIQYTDKKSRLILETKSDNTSSQNANTYFIYDDKVRLNLLIPPGSTNGIAELNYVYTYDERDNILSKKIPGKDIEYFKYNDRNLIKFKEDGWLRNNNTWYTFTYDGYGREMTSGFYNSSVPVANIVSDNYSPTEKLTESQYGLTGLEKDKLKKYKSKVPELNDWIDVTYNYDDCGRVDNIYGNSHINFNLGSEITKYEYDGADNILKVTQYHNNNVHTITNNSILDHRGRTLKRFHSIDGNEFPIAEYFYDHENQLVDRKLGITGGGALQSIDYTYHTSGLLERVNQSTLGGTNINGSVCNLPQPNNQSSNENDLFYTELKYDATISNSGSIPQKNGNISNTIWRVRGRTREVYGFQYDYQDRMIQAHHGELSDTDIYGSTLDRYGEKITYDERGNITTLLRRGRYYNGTCYSTGEIDNLTYFYQTNSNRLNTISDAASGNQEMGYKEGTTSYNYADGNGNTTYDPSRNVTFIFNHLNLPVKADLQDGREIHWIYDSDGTMLRKIVKESSMILETRDYINGIEYAGNKIESIIHSEGRLFNTCNTEQSIVLNDIYSGNKTFKAASILSGGQVVAGSQINFIASKDISLTSEFHAQNSSLFHAKIESSGCYSPTWRCEYIITDHLGNARLCFSDLNGNGAIETPEEILQENHYYPFGMKMKGPWMHGNNPDDRYQYNAMQQLADFNLDYNLASYRTHDPQIGRWLQTDPLAEHLVDISPFNAMNNNPVSNMDPAGTSPFGFQSGPNIGLTGIRVPGSNSGPFGAYLPKFGGGDFNIYGSNSTFGNEYIWDPEKRKWIKISNVGEEYYHNYIVGRWNENGAYEVFYNLDYNPQQDWRINGTLFTQAQVFKMGLYDKNLSKYLLKSDYGAEYMKHSIRNNPNSEFFLTYGSMLIMGFVSPTSYVPLAVRGGVGALNLAKGAQVATAAKGVPNTLYHYTSKEAAASISKNGLRVGKDGFSYLTNNGTLKSLQAQIELALPANRALPNSILQINTRGLNPSIIRRVQGNLPGYGAGGGTEFLFKQHIPASAIKILR